MDADEGRYEHQALTGRIIKVFYEVYNELGTGFMEQVYRRAMVIALGDEGLLVECEVPMTARFRGNVVGDFRADMVSRVASWSS